MNRRTFLKNGLWLPFAPSILRAGVLPSSRRVATPLVAPSGYTANASVFDGSNDYMTRGADLTGNANGKKGTISAWIKLLGGDGTDLFFVSSSSYKFYFYRGAGNIFGVYGNPSLNLRTTSTYVSGSGWKHVFMCWDCVTAGARHVYVNGVEDTNELTFTNNDILYAQTNYSVGSYTDGSSRFNGELCELYVNLAEYLNDPTKFASGGKPISLGTNGATPTGTAPIIYQKNPYDSFGTNSGTGGNFTVTGALTAGTPP